MKGWSQRVYPRRKRAPGAPEDDDMLKLMLLLIAILACGLLYSKLAG